MRIRNFVFIAALVSPAAYADMDIQVGKVTVYSGNCKYDSYGGGKTTSDGTDFKTHTVEDPGKGTAKAVKRLPAADDKGNSYSPDTPYAVAAVPQKRGQVASIYGCFFKDEQNYNGTLFKAADHYGTGSNGMSKYDAGRRCQPGLNNMTKPATTINVLGACGGVRGGAGDEVQRAPKKPRPKRRRA